MTTRTGPRPYLRSEHQRDKGIACSLFATAGWCPVVSCPYMHCAPDYRKPLPTEVCNFFRRYRCLRDDCPYYHLPQEKLDALTASGATDYCPLDGVPMRDPLSKLDEEMKGLAAGEITGARPIGSVPDDVELLIEEQLKLTAEPKKKEKKKKGGVPPTSDESGIPPRPTTEVPPHTHAHHHAANRPTPRHVPAPPTVSVAQMPTATVDFQQQSPYIQHVYVTNQISAPPSQPPQLTVHHHQQHHQHQMMHHPMMMTTQAQPTQLMQSQPPPQQQQQQPQQTTTYIFVHQQPSQAPPPQPPQSQGIFLQTGYTVGPPSNSFAPHQLQQVNSNPNGAYTMAPPMNNNWTFVPGTSQTPVYYHHGQPGVDMSTVFAIHTAHSP